LNILVDYSFEFTETTEFLECNVIA
jgi:hypothetical protein